VGGHFPFLHSNVVQNGPSTSIALGLFSTVVHRSWPNTWPPVLRKAFSRHSVAFTIYAGPECFYVAQPRLKPPRRVALTSLLTSSLSIGLVYVSCSLFSFVSAFFSSFTFSHSLVDDDFFRCFSDCFLHPTVQPQASASKWFLRSRHTLDFDLRLYCIGPKIIRWVQSTFRDF
jgi:hypothetical protein